MWEFIFPLPVSPVCAATRRVRFEPTDTAPPTAVLVVIDSFTVNAPAGLAN